MSVSKILSKNISCGSNNWVDLSVNNIEVCGSITGPGAPTEVFVRNSSTTGSSLVTEPSPKNYEIRRLRASTGINLIDNPDYVEISSTGGGSTFNGFYVNSTAPPVDTYVEDFVSPMLFNNVIYNTGSLNWVPNTQTTNIAQFDTILITGRIFIKTMGYEDITLQIRDYANPIGDNFIISEIKSTTPPLTSVAVNRYYEFAYTWRKLGPITGPVSIGLLDLNGSNWIYQVNTNTYLCMTKLF